MAKKKLTPTYSDAAYGGESVILENDFIKLIMHKRINGWGWGELYAPSGNSGPDKLMAVMEYLGEADVVGHHYPLRLDADECKAVETKDGRKLIFKVELQLPQGPWMRWNNYKCIEGEVELEIKRDSSWINYSLLARAKHNLEIKSLRGPWLHLGAGSYGVEKKDAIFPGIEWVIDKEWSSGTHNYPHKFANHITPHPRKIAFPLMTLSHDGISVGLSWKEQYLDQVEEVQPVFAVPNFIDRRDESLIGLMYPSVTWGLQENSLKADPPVTMSRSGIQMQAEIGIQKGDSLDMIITWLQKHGMPEPDSPRFEYQNAIEKIANAFNTNLWIGDKKGYENYGCYPQQQTGFLRSWHLAPCQPYLDIHWDKHVDLCKRIPKVVDYYISKHDNSLSRELKKKVQYCLDNSTRNKRTRGRFGKNFDLFEWFSDTELKELGNKIIKSQKNNGAFPFDPEGRNQAEHLKEAAVWKPLGQAGDSCLNLCVTASFLLLLIGDCLADKKYLNAARKGLNFAMPMERPEGGDWWETPLHAPNLMTAGYTAITYYVAYNLFADEKYLAKAIRFIRSLLPFTHLWETVSVKKLYQPTPLFGATAWHAMDWSSRNIMWQILMLFELSSNLNIDWSKIDQDVDWEKYQRGITVAGLRWLADHTDQDWLTMASREKKDINEDILLKTINGELDMVVPDNFDPVTNAYGGMPIFIAPDTLASNIIDIVN